MTKPMVDVTQSVGESDLARKTYASPQLVMYGNISQITRALGTKGSVDGAAKGSANNKS